MRVGNMSYISRAAAVVLGCAGWLTWRFPASLKQCEPEDFIFFCAHKEGAPYRTFSNWYDESELKNGGHYGLGGQFFWCAEQEFIAAKMLHREAKDGFTKVMEVKPSADEEECKKRAALLKKLGREAVPNFDLEGWTAASPDAMLLAVRHEFKGNPELAALLLSTGDKIIVEAAHYDKIWGIGLDTWDGKNRGALRRVPCGKIEWAVPPEQWPKNGNGLGKTLMQVRCELQTEALLELNCF